MSVSIFWQPINERNYIKGSSWLRSALEKIFGEMPFVLTGDHYKQLQAMAAVSPEGDSCPFSELLTAIENNDSIRVDKWV